MIKIINAELELNLWGVLDTVLILTVIGKEMHMLLLNEIQVPKIKWMLTIV